MSASRPQAINALGGYGPRGKDAAEAAKILADARAIAEAGCFAMVIEGVLPDLADAITAAVPCPTIGIGASAGCDGQILVTEDLLGMFERTPRFVKRMPVWPRPSGRPPPNMPPTCAPAPSRAPTSFMAKSLDPRARTGGVGPQQPACSGPSEPDSKK